MFGVLRSGEVEVGGGDGWCSGIESLAREQHILLTGFQQESSMVSACFQSAKSTTAKAQPPRRTKQSIQDGRTHKPKHPTTGHPLTVGLGFWSGLALPLLRPPPCVCYPIHSTKHRIKEFPGIVLVKTR